MPSDSVLAALDRAATAGLLPAGTGLLLAVSGGADSMALLTAAAEKAPRFGWRLAVAHVHHGWRAREADRDLAFVRDHARRFGFPFFERHCDARGASRREGLSPEAGARLVRYPALQEMAREAGARRIATAHQAEDRIETFLIASERAGGTAALAGPRERRADGVVRPLIDVSRGDILAFLSSRGIAFRRDATNGDLRLARNRIRRRIAAASLAERAGWESAARACARRQDRIDRELEDLARRAIREGRGCVLADARAIRASAPELQRRAVEQAAAPFARPGRAPMTGREREQVLRRLALGSNFRFEAGRRISVELTGGILAFRPKRRAETAAEVYDSRQPTSHGDPAF